MRNIWCPGWSAVEEVICASINVFLVESKSLNTKVLLLVLGEKVNKYRKSWKVA